jgi:thiamine-phosphate pyrophosphorylase
VIRCLITDGTASANETQWIEHKAAWLADGIELMQIRERDLTARQLAELTHKVLRLPNPHGARILINDRADVAIACGAHGVHLRDGSVLPGVFARPEFLVSIACHSVAEAEKTRGADFIVLAPIFCPLSKSDARPALGVTAITELAAHLAGGTPTPVLALGGITARNAQLCMEAGAAGVAGISYFNRLPTDTARPSARLSVRLSVLP